MAQETTETQAPDVFHAAGIENQILRPRRPVSILQGIARMMTPGSSPVHTVPRISPRIAVPAGAKTEGTADFTRVQIGTDAESCTSQVVGFQLRLSGELLQDDATGQMLAAAQEDAFNALRVRLETDVMALAASSTATTGAVTNACTAAEVRAALATFRASCVPQSENIAVVLSNEAFAAFVESLESTGATGRRETTVGSIVGPAPAMTYMGANIYCSACVAADTTGWSNFITEMGSDAGLGIVVWKPLTWQKLATGPESFNEDYVAFYRAAGILTSNDASEPPALLEFLTA